MAKKHDKHDKHEKKEEVKEEKKSKLVTYLGPGPLSGEYRFAEIPGSVTAASEEEAIQKAEELAIKHPNLLQK